ncbi:MAG: hypothetical protein GX957_10440, partial [Clostridiaceae bacterium]|nr:hypothetical protein [Clostridiaceae bacterium]
MSKLKKIKDYRGSGCINTQKIAEEYRLSQWTEVIQEKQESGLSVKDYCETQGITTNKY